MHIALPELDGRIISRAISFKDLAWHNERSQSDVVCYRAHVERMDFVAELARKWAALARLPNADKRVALVLANYPTRDGRIGNGVGLDTPAAALNILRAMQQQGYPVADLPDSGTALIHAVLGGVTNDLDGVRLEVECADTPTVAGSGSSEPSRVPWLLHGSWIQRPLRSPLTISSPGAIGREHTPHWPGY